MRPPQEDRVYAIVTALLEKAERVKALQELDGHPLSVILAEENVEQANDVLALCYGDGETVVVGMEPMGNMGAHIYKESVRVVCCVWSWTGATGNDAVLAAMARCKDLLSAFRKQLNDDPTLGEVCSNTRFSQDAAWQPKLYAEGVACSVGFTVDAETVGV